MINNIDKYQNMHATTKTKVKVFYFFIFFFFCLTLVCLFVLKLTVGFKAIKSCMRWFQSAHEVNANKVDRQSSWQSSYQWYVLLLQNCCIKKIGGKNSTSRRECGVRFKLKKKCKTNMTHIINWVPLCITSIECITIVILWTCRIIKTLIQNSEPATV